MTTAAELMSGFGIELPDQLVADVEARSLIPDSSGRVPGDAGYVRTVDHYFAAYLAIPYARAQSVVTSATSEGTSVSSSPPDWSAFARLLRSLSPILRAQGSGLVTYVPLDYGSKRRMPMRHVGLDYDAVSDNAPSIW